MLGGQTFLGGEIFARRETAESPSPSHYATLGFGLGIKSALSPPVRAFQSTGLRELSLKTALLLALVSAKRVGDIHVLSFDDACMRFGPNDCSVTLKPEVGYVPKSLSTPFRAQVISLPAFSPEPPASLDYDQRTLCPVRALRFYALSDLPRLGSLTNCSRATADQLRDVLFRSIGCLTG